MDMASNQPDNLALTAEQLREYSAAFNADRANLVAANAAVSNGILQASTSYRGVRELPRTFSVELKQGSITSQEHSGRCWMFASLNTLRYDAQVEPRRFRVLRKLSVLLRQAGEVELLP